MSDTTESAVRRLRSDSPTVDAVCRQIGHLREGQDAELAVTFAEIFFSKAPPEFLHERSTDDLTRLVLAAYDFLRRSRPDRVDVEVVNPDVDTEGWYAPVSVVRTNLSERPFIVDTIREFLHAQDLAIEHIVYPVLTVERDDGGEVVAVGPSALGDTRESLVHCEVARVTEADRLDQIRAELQSRLEDVMRATDDFGAMIDAVNEVVTELAERAATLEDRREEIHEIQDFLRWLRDGGFVFLGYRAYDIVDADDGTGRAIVVEEGSGLGVLRDERRSTYAAPVPIEDLDESLRDVVVSGPILMVSKANAESTVHRRARMDYIGIKKLAPDGSIVGEHRFLGLFTSKAFAEDAENIPILRRKLRHILDEAGVGEGSHDFKEIITIFNSLPKEEIFLASAEEIAEDVRTILTSYHTSGVRVSLRPDPLRRGVSVMVILPKEKFSGSVRRAIEAALVDIFSGEVLNYHLALGEGDQARLHFYVGAPQERVEAVRREEVEGVIREIARTWVDRVQEGLERVRPPDAARRLARRYGDTFSAEYQAATDPLVAVDDILELEAMQADGRKISISLANRDRSAAALGAVDVTELKVFLQDEELVLSDFMPILENAGLRVIAVNPFEIGGEDGRFALYVFAVQDGEGRPLDVEGRGALLAETILMVRCGDAINDTMNRLVLTAGLHWREVDVLRAYVGYAFQIGAVPSRLSLPSALVRYPGLARELFELFETRFDPEAHATVEERLAAGKDICDAFHGSLESVSSLADDRALRRLEELILATQRTNFYRHGGRTPSFRSGGVPYVSFKFACAELDVLRSSRLVYEVWVHSARMEGVHLRGARVARGGIRWSDRPDDFRTEILGLVKTQVVKNAVIVPGGSKGGFVPRLLPRDPEARFEEGKEQYRTLIRGLLDITDNLDAEGRTVPPPGVVSFDEPDPYLVVAADKGTATFSDVANGVSAEYGFWLGDAFASGGSHGYDHKAVGITARGAWESVKRHFREMDKDIQREPFTVAGIGDMSGDVFGNGMLLSEQIRLVAAFDHRHVFIDPDPDPAASFAERKRLFEMGRSSWDDYDRSALSEGGMIIPRGAKEVELTPRARAALGLDENVPEVLDGEALVRAVLCAPVELLWNGGIGTYVKSATESHNDAGDPSNDAVRVDVPMLRCKVVGEGGNLGFTQRARIEFALGGGRINTDALDNSGGVDMSDHEVNLKILLAPAVSDGRLSEEARNELLEELTESVAEHVLDHNRSQSLAISLDLLRVGAAEDDFRDLMFSLEKSGELDRAAEGLPTLDVLVERREEGQTLTRPELCVLLAYAKLAVKSRLLAGGLADDAFVEPYLTGYFPTRAVKTAGKENLEQHRLRREIVVCQVTNELVDLMGAAFVHRVMRDTGASAEEVVRAWLIASRLAGHQALLRRMAAQEQAMDTRVAYRWLLGLTRVLERTTRWVLSNVDAEESPARVVKENLKPLETLRGSFGDLVAGRDRDLFLKRVEEIRELGADEAFSSELITLRFLDQLLEIAAIARRTRQDVSSVARVYYRISEVFQIPWLQQITVEAAGDDQWEQRAVQLLLNDLSRAHRRLAAAVVRGGAEGGGASALEELMDREAPAVRRFQAVLSDLQAEDAPGLAASSVAVRELISLAGKVAPAA
ncbi:MAG: NAD-glutamate dehydrogenase [Gemmatimonadota bacterium]